MKTIFSPCIYCGVGCRLQFQVAGNKLLKVLPDTKDPVSRGRPCIKGLSIAEVVEEGRIKRPWIRVGRRLQEATWNQVLDFIYQKTKDLAPQEVFFSGSGKITNEDNFVIQKFARVVFQTNNIDNCCSRLCHQATVQAMNDCFGIPNLTRNRNLTEVDLFLIIGSNPASNYPAFWSWVLEEKKKRGLRIISIQSILNLTTEQLNRTTDCYLLINQGTELVLLNGIINWILEHKAYSQSQERVEGFSRLKRTVVSYSPDFVSRTTGVRRKKLEKVYRLVARARKLGVLHGMGLTQHVNGIENVHSLLNLVILKEGCILTQRGEINVQGAGDMACSPFFFPVGDFTQKSKLEKIWQTKLPAGRGKNTIESFFLSPVKAAFISGFNPAQSLPALDTLWQNLEKIFLVLIDSYWNKTAEFASVLLPAPLLIERRGTITNGERRVRVVNQVLSPSFACRPEWWIYRELAKVFQKGRFFPYKEEKEIFAEIVKTVPDYQDIDPEQIYQGIDCFAAKKAKFFRFYPEKWEGYDDPRSEKYPFLLTTFRLPYSFLTSEATEKSPTLKKLSPPPGFYLNKQEAQKLGFAGGEEIEVISTQGRLKGKVILEDKIPKGLVGATFHSKNFFVNRLFPLDFDEETFTPNFKATAVRIEKVREGSCLKMRKSGKVIKESGCS